MLWSIFLIWRMNKGFTGTWFFLISQAELLPIRKNGQTTPWSPFFVTVDYFGDFVTLLPLCRIYENKCHNDTDLAFRGHCKGLELCKRFKGRVWESKGGGSNHQTLWIAQQGPVLSASLIPLLGSLNMDSLPTCHIGTFGQDPLV